MDWIKSAFIEYFKPLLWCYEKAGFCWHDWWNGKDCETLNYVRVCNKCNKKQVWQGYWKNL